MLWSISNINVTFLLNFTIMKTLTYVEMEQVNAGKSWSELSEGCQWALIGMGLSYVSLFCLTGGLGAIAVAVGLHVSAPLGVALAC